jgi:hypothetical protein
MPIVVNVNIVSKLKMKMNDEELVTLPKEQIDFLLMKANIELLQKVDRLLNIIELEINKAQEQ